MSEGAVTMCPADGEIGKLVYRGDAFVPGYWNRPQAGSRAWLPRMALGKVAYGEVKGWIRTGPSS